MPNLDTLPALPAAVARHTLYVLTGALPPPLSDFPEELAIRGQAAITALADLHPANAYEARLAARAVATDAHAMDCLCQAAVPATHPDEVRRCRAQANAMMRASESALRSLRALQATRAKPETAAPAVAASEARQFQPQAVEAVAIEASHPDIAAQADEYARSHRKRAALIRRLRRLPERIDCGPIAPELVNAIITGTSAILRSLDSHTGGKLRRAA
jgi:hypothetical protein